MQAAGCEQLLVRVTAFRQQIWSGSQEPALRQPTEAPPGQRAPASMQVPVPVMPPPGWMQQA